MPGQKDAFTATKKFLTLVLHVTYSDFLYMTVFKIRLLPSFRYEVAGTPSGTLRPPAQGELLAVSAAAERSCHRGSLRLQ